MAVTAQKPRLSISLFLPLLPFFPPLARRLAWQCFSTALCSQISLWNIAAALSTSSLCFFLVFSSLFHLLTYQFYNYSCRKGKSLTLVLLCFSFSPTYLFLYILLRLCRPQSLISTFFHHCWGFSLYSIQPVFPSLSSVPTVFSSLFYSPFLLLFIAQFSLHIS